MSDFVDEGCCDGYAGLQENAGIEIICVYMRMHARQSTAQQAARDASLLVASTLQGLIGSAYTLVILWWMSCVYRYISLKALSAQLCL